MSLMLLLYSLVGVQVKLRGAQEGILEEARCVLEAKELARQQALEGHSRQRRCVSRTKQREASCAQGNAVQQQCLELPPGGRESGEGVGGEGPGGHRSSASS